MRRTATFSAVMVLVLLLAAGCARGPGHEPVTVQQIVEMARSGTPTDEILGRMRESGTIYRLEASQLADLREKGVPDEVIDYMQQTYLDAVRRDQRLEDMRHWTPGGPGWWYRGPHFSPYRWRYW